jgi:hypothetical protein
MSSQYWRNNAGYGGEKIRYAHNYIGILKEFKIKKNSCKKKENSNSKDNLLRLRHPTD